MSIDLLQRRVHDGKSWGKWEALHVRPAAAPAEFAAQPQEDPDTCLVAHDSKSFTYCFGSGKRGKLFVQTEVIQPRQREDLCCSILSCDYFRQYKIQAGPEPRTHFLLHDEATDDWERKQPGYRYGAITMKSRPLKLLPELEAFSQDMANRFKRKNKRWNMGVDVVFYRDGKDYIGKHSDDDQGERRIVTVLLHSPRARVVEIETKRPKNTPFQNGDEQFRLFLQPGYAYVMSKKMQKYYLHSVPADPKSVGPDHAKGERLVVVFRAGKQQRYQKDSGESCCNLAPRPDPKYEFEPIPGLVEGKYYTRLEIRSLGAHRSIQRGVSGSKEIGCDAIILSQESKENVFNTKTLLYMATPQQGAYALLTSAVKKYPIRVFCSMKLLPVCNDDSTKGPQQYRYEGCYEITRVQYDGCNGTPIDVLITQIPKKLNDVVHKFHLSPIKATAQQGYQITGSKRPREVEHSNTIQNSFRKTRTGKYFSPWW